MQKLTIGKRLPRKLKKQEKKLLQSKLCLPECFGYKIFWTKKGWELRSREYRKAKGM